MPEANKANLLAAWLDGTLTDEQRQQFEQLCQEDEVFARQVETANQTLMLSTDYQDQAVPDWHRDITLPHTENRWWGWQGLPALSFATSMLAIVMVLSGVNVRVADGELTLALNSEPSQKQVEDIVNARLDEYQLAQQQALTEFAATLQQQQLDTSAQLTNYLLTSSRQERREDFAELIKFVNQQRSDDQQFYARQLNKLEQQIADPSAAHLWLPETRPE